MLLAGFYFALVTEHDRPEIVTGVVAGLVGAAAAVASGTAERGQYSPTWRWLTPLPLRTGHVGDYVTWLLVGVVVLVATVTLTTR